MNDRQYQRIITRLDLLEQREPPLAAEFVTTATDPADDLLVVAVGWDDGEHTFGPVRWSPIGGALPQAGDECVIVERDDGVWQVVGWWSDSQGTGVGQAAVDALDARLDALEAGPPTTTAVSSFANSWVNFDADRPAGYYKDRGRVFLTGVIKSGTVGMAAFTLPSGYRPGSANGLLFSVVSNGLFGVVTVNSSGVVNPATGSNTYFSLDGISFRHT